MDLFLPDEETGFTALQFQQAPASSILFPEGNPYPNLLSFIATAPTSMHTADQNLLKFLSLSVKNKIRIYYRFLQSLEFEFFRKT